MAGLAVRFGKDAIVYCGANRPELSSAHRSESWEAKSAQLIGPGERGVDAIEQIPGGELDGLSAIKAGINYRRRQAGER